MLKRMRIFMNGLIYQTKKHRLPIELIFVEWNPPTNAPLLHTLLPKPEPEHGFMQVKYVIVPPQIHQTYRFAAQMPLYQMIAKNVGIRRAIAPFILCTNVDLLFSDALFALIARQNLDPNCFYRANRCDIPNTIEESQTVAEQLDFAQNNILSRAGLCHYYPHLANAHPLLIKNKWVAKYVNYLVGLKRKWFNNPSQINLWMLDTDACGDFTLMSAQAWHAIQGYPELDLYSIHIDSMGLIAAAAAGYKQVVLPQDACTYHIYHLSGWASMTPLEKLHFLHQKPGIGWDIVSQCAQQLLNNPNMGYGINKPDWGFANHNLRVIEP